MSLDLKQISMSNEIIENIFKSMVALYFQFLTEYFGVCTKLCFQIFLAKKTRL